MFNCNKPREFLPLWGDMGGDIHDSIELISLLDEYYERLNNLKLNKETEITNAGKIMAINDEGEIVPINFEGEQVGSILLTKNISIPNNLWVGNGSTWKLDNYDISIPNYKALGSLGSNNGNESNWEVKKWVDVNTQTLTWWQRTRNEISPSRPTNANIKLLYILSN